MNKIKVAFFGTPSFAIPILEALIENYDVTLVVSQMDKPFGRSGKLKPSPIKELALKNNIEVFTPEKIKQDYEKIIKTEIDLIVTCAYGQIIPKEILDYPKLGCINVHASLLPKLRGGAPIHHAIIDGYKKTGITIMYMAEKMDAGDIISQTEIEILDNDNVGSLHDKLSVLGAKLLLETLPKIITNTNDRITQNEDLVTYGYNIKREEEKLNFNKESKDIINQIRGLNPWPMAYILIDNQEVKVIEGKIMEDDSNKEVGSIIEASASGIKVKTIDGSILITKIKPFSKQEMFVKDYLNSRNKDELIGKKVY